ncbi:hypothetical protein BGX26_002127 [Mortierella sp. AD094]|nr:hypothetical protein BGX26_002127 [Mortierella sp. AD094]
MTVREGLQIEISGIPAENGKCRVETQLKITLQLKNAQGQIIKDWKQLRLPRPLIAKEKHRMEKFNGRGKHIQDAEILTLEARLVCDHDMTKVLECCDNCIGRERKRAHRRKESQKLPGPLSSIPVFGSVNPKTGGSLPDEDDSVPPTPTDPIEYQAWERSRIMVFSSTEYVDLSSGQCLLPTRITCYCRHHNEKVGFRIQFTAKDSTGVTLTSVLTHPVMMMDDHKSGKRATPAQSKSVGETTSSARKKSIMESTGSTTTTATAGSGNKPDCMQNHDYDDDQEDMDQDEGFTEEQDEIDLEAGHHIPQNSYTNDMKFVDSEILSGDVLSPLGSAMDRIGAKRRVDDDNAMEDIQTQSFTDLTRGPFRRKTSHDVSSSSAGTPSLFSNSSQSFPSSSSIPSQSQSPFMLGSPFANEGHSNTFTSSLPQALVTGGSFLDQKNIDMFLQSSLTTSPTASRGDVTQGHTSKDLPDHEASMMEFTTLDESMSSPLDLVDTFSTSNLIADMNGSKPGQTVQDQSTSADSQALAMRSSFSIHAPNYSSVSSATATASTVGSNPFSPAGMFTSAFSTTFSSPLNGSVSALPLNNNASGMSSSFLDASQMQEFQNFKRQSLLQQEQQQMLLQLQQGIQQQTQQHQIETKQVPWTAPKVDDKDPYWNMRMAMSQTTNPSSSAFISVSASLSEDGTKDRASSPMADNKGSEGPGDAPLAPKKRGRPRKAAPEADSPVLSPKSPSPSPPPALAPSASTAAATAAHYLLFQQRQQQQLQHHQQQLQQQQKQAILARQKPRVQKLIPSRGPVEGGTEITLLGSGFYPGMVPTFDGVPALSVQLYGPETLICRLPPRTFPGTVVVKAQNPLSALAGSASASGSGVAAGGADKEGATSSDLVRTMTQLFGGPSSGGPNNSLLDDDVGALFEYEESKGDRDLIALALQVLGMKMNGRVEPPHQVAMRIMGTAAASNAIMGSGSSSSQGQLQLPQLQQSQPQMQLQLQQQTQQQQQQQQLLGFGGLQQNSLQQNMLSQQLQMQSQAQLQQQIQPQQLQLQQQHQQQLAFGSLPESTSVTNGSILSPGMLGGFGNYMNSMGGSNGGSL